MKSSLLKRNKQMQFMAVLYKNIPFLHLSCYCISIMEQECVTTSAIIPPLTFFFKSKLRRHQVIEILSDSDSLESAPSHLPPTSFPQSFQNLMQNCKNRQETQRQEDLHQMEQSGIKKQQNYQDRLKVFTTSNCHFDFSSHSPSFHSESFTQSSSPNQSVSLSEEFSPNRPQNAKKVRSNPKMLKKERITKTKVQIAIEIFNRHYDKCEDLAQNLQNQLWKPLSKVSLNHPTSDQSNSSPSFSQKMTRRHFNRLKPYIDYSENDLDLEEELKRLEKGKYRYNYSVIVSKINELATRVNATYLKKKTHAFVPNRPVVPLYTSKHATMVHLLKERFSKRAVVYLD